MDFPVCLSCKLELLYTSQNVSLNGLSSATNKKVHKSRLPIHQPDRKIHQLDPAQQTCVSLNSKSTCTVSSPSLLFVLPLSPAFFEVLRSVTWRFLTQLCISCHKKEKVSHATKAASCLIEFSGIAVLALKYTAER